MCMPTFSLNVNYYEKVPQIRRLESQLKDSNREYWYEAYISIFEGKQRNINFSLDNYSKKTLRYDKIDAAKSEELSIEGMVEKYDDIDGFSVPTESFEDDVVMRCDTENMVKQFLDLRENLWLLNGCDIWRLLELTLFYRDRQAAIKLRMVMEDEEQTEFFMYLLKNRKAIDRLKEIFKRG